MERKFHAIVVDDDPIICELLSHILEEDGIQALSMKDGDSALKMLGTRMPELMLVDLKLPGIDGMEVLKRAKEMDPDLPIVIITGYASIPGCVKAIKGGAQDYISKPFSPCDVMKAVHRALAERELKRKLSNHFPKDSLREMMGPSEAVSRIISEVNRVSKTDFTVIILGETGTGKELVARAIHDLSYRSQSPFIPVDCGAIPETLFESELFGHEKGAFTGANSQKIGKFELAQSGTLFLDEISNMPLPSQAKLLRVLQDRLVSRVGGTKPVEIDVRVLAASNNSLDNLAMQGKFRSDLLFRLDEFILKIPPLRERKEDIPYLAKRFLDLTNIELNKTVEGFSEPASNLLSYYGWPGNVRQLRSTIRRAVLLADKVVTENLLDINNRVSNHGPGINVESWDGSSLKDIVRMKTSSLEREVIIRVLNYTGGNKAKAARLLQVDYKTLHTKIKQLEIPVND